MYLGSQWNKNQPLLFQDDIIVVYKTKDIQGDSKVFAHFCHSYTRMLNIDKTLVFDIHDLIAII